MMYKGVLIFMSVLVLMSCSSETKSTSVLIKENTKYAKMLTGQWKLKVIRCFLVESSGSIEKTLARLSESKETVPDNYILNFKESGKLALKNDNIGKWKINDLDLSLEGVNKEDILIDLDSMNYRIDFINERQLRMHSYYKDRSKTKIKIEYLFVNN